jgi:hypothetical protein
MTKPAILLLFLGIFSLAGFSQVVVTKSSGLMAEASLTSKRVATAYEGSKVDLIEKSGEFWKVTLGKKSGFIHESCLSNYVNPNKKEQENAVAENAGAEKIAVIPVAPDSALIVRGPRNRLYYEGRILTAPQLKALLITNPEAKEKWQTRNFLYYFGMIMAGTGGFIVGSSLGSGDIGMILTGVGIAGVGIGSAALSDGMLKKAISIYNHGIMGTPRSLSLRLGMADHGYGFTLSF